LKKIYLFCLLPLLLTGCDESFNQNELKTQYNRLLGMNIKTSIDHCSTKDDVPNCHFENGIYILKIGSSVTDEQQQRVKVQVTDFISGSHSEVRRLFANKRIVIGLVEKEPDPSTLSPQDEFILALADSVNQANGLPKVLDGIELVYTNLEDDDGNGNKIYIDETKKLAGYQKLVQLFDYYVDHIASYLKENPIGNYKEALSNGMNIIEGEVSSSFDEETLYIPEGGALKEAQYGLQVLANEIRQWAKEKNINDLKVFLPSGTGTTALYLQKYLPYEVLTCACVGNEEYLEKQFSELEKHNHPKILGLEKKYHFGKLYKEFYLLYKELLAQTNIEFDLLYDCKGWMTMMNYLKNNEKSHIIYIHQGGIIGNISMLERYQHKWSNI